MTTDEVQQTGGQPPVTDDDDFSSERYVALHAAGPPRHREPTETVILGTVPGEDDDPPNDVAHPDPVSTSDDDDRADVAELDAGADDRHLADVEVDDHELDTHHADDPDAVEPYEDTDGETPGAALAESDAIDGAEEPPADTMDPDHPHETETLDSSGSDATAESGEDHLEMRQVAGLTAGSMMKLTVGRAFEFNESNEGGSFSLRVLENGEVVVHPGSARAVIDEVEVDEPMMMGDALLNVSSACFSVRRPRPPASTESRMEAIGAAFASIDAIHVPALGTEEPLPPEQLMGSRLGTIINRNPLTRGAVGQQAWGFLQSIRQTRSVVAERHRLMHPDPEELKTRLSRLDPGLWERSREHPLFGRFGIGYANIPWEPRFDNPELIPAILHEPIIEMSLLPWVPATANLLYGPLGIVGKRAARLAACRHAILSLAALSMPGEVQFAIRSGNNTATSWNWTRALPPIMASDENSPYVVTVIDGADGARVDEAARLAAHEEAASNETVRTEPAGETEAEADVDVDVDVETDGGDAGVSAEPEGTAESPVIDLTDPDDLDVLGAASQALTPGYIVLADTLEELTQPCGTVLQIEPDGTGSVTNHLNETIQVTPIGVTEAYAHDMATRIADILTDSFL